MRPMKYLQNLSLIMMKVSGEDISLFLKNCPFLRKLRISQSVLTGDVHISEATPALEDLRIAGCVYLKSAIVNISAPNLSIVCVDARPGHALRFKNVPRVVEALFNIEGPEYTMQHFTSTLSCLTSQLHKLTLYGPDADKLSGKGFPQLPNLKELILYKHTCLLSLANMISSCPRLQCLTFKCFAKAKDATCRESYGALTFRGSCAANIIRSLTYIEESGEFQKIKSPIWFISEYRLQLYVAMISPQLELYFQVELRYQFKSYFLRYS
ncbi:uncharacterized protein LOC125219263 [Salvia hispanica]|uniref:uncharacterized protein LOC125219263 n=1 Tax=Salvia hispanica TaxID=49212 RepID=UPI0020095B3A|nr:uncharacterized protein LOC125219263 [Salvia hispanica]